MTNEKESLELKVPWHRGYLDLRTWTITIVGGVIVIIIYNIFSPVFSYIFHNSAIVVGYISQSTIDRAYANAVVNPMFHIFLSVFVTLIVAVTGFSFATSLEFILKGSKYAKSDTATVASINKNPSLLPKIILSILWLLMLLLTLLVVSIPLLMEEVSVTEQRRILALDPFITDQEQKDLLGQWGRVQTKADFDRLMGAMEKLASGHHTTLPRRLDI